MSIEYSNARISDSLPKSCKVNIPINKLNNKTGYNYRSAVEWSAHKENALSKFFRLKKYPYRNYENFSGIPEDLHSELRIFMLSLDAYIESSNPLLPINFIIAGVGDKNFAKHLKRVKQKSIMLSWDVEMFSIPEWYNDVKGYSGIIDIGQIFNYRYLIHWRNEEEVDDYLYSQIPLKQFKFMKEFENAVNEILPERDSFNKIDPEEILFQISPSVSYDKNATNKSKHYLVKPNNLTFSTERKVCHRNLIDVSPENIRDSVILDVTDLNTVSFIDAQVLEILSAMGNHIHLRDQDEIDRRFRKLKENSYFLHRDMKKEGLTKPRQLLKIMLRVISKNYPDLGLEKFVSFYDNFVLNNNGEIIENIRGHGLGMANSLTTLMQLAIHHILKDEMVENYGISIESANLLVLNDDFVIGFDEREHVDLYWDKEDEILDGLNILRSPEKSFVANGAFTIAEMYCRYGLIHRKESYQRRELYLPLASVNIRHAKQTFISVQNFCEKDIATNILEELVSYWGYEFFPEEISYPYRFGGWINDSLYGIDLTFFTLEQLPYKSCVGRAALALMSKRYIKKGGKKYLSPICKLFNFPKFPEEYNNIFDDLTLFEVREKYGRYSTSSRGFIFWQKEYKRVKYIYNSIDTISQDEVCIKMINHYKATTFFPAEFMIDRVEKVNWIKTDLKEFYIDPCPKIALLAKYNSYLERDFKEEYSIHFCERDRISERILGEVSRTFDRNLKNRLNSDFYINETTWLYLPEDETIEVQEYYVNPYKLGQACSSGLCSGFPIIFDRYKSPLIKQKLEVYGRFLTFEEIRFATENELSRELIKKIVSKCSLIDFSYRVPEIIPKEKDPDAYVQVLTDGDDIKYELWRNNFLCDTLVRRDRETKEIIEEYGEIQDLTYDSEFWEKYMGLDTYIPQCLTKDGQDAYLALRSVFNHLYETACNSGDADVDKIGNSRYFITKFGTRLAKELRIMDVIQKHNDFYNQPMGIDSCPGMFDEDEDW